MASTSMPTNMTNVSVPYVHVNDTPMDTWQQQPPFNNIYTQYLPPDYAAFMQQQYAQQQQIYLPQQQYAPVASTSSLSPSQADDAGHQQQQQMQYQQMQGDGGEQLTDEERVLAAQYSTVSQIEATPYTDPETGEAVYPCPFCEKQYGGKHGRSIWRRHLCNKHGIPLHIQPRRTRWDNDPNKPKDEAERHKRTLESKRRWAAKNRADKQRKRKGGDDGENDGGSREGSTAPYGYDANDTSNNSSFGSIYDETEQHFMAHAIAQAEADNQAHQATMLAATHQNRHPHQQLHPSQFPPQNWQATPAGQHYYPNQPPRPASACSSASTSSAYPHLQQPHVQQQPSLSPNFIPYERIPLARQNSAPPARPPQQAPTQANTAPPPSLQPSWPSNNLVLHQPTPSTSLAVPPIMQRSLSAPLMHMMPNQVKQQANTPNFHFDASQKSTPVYQQQLHPAQTIFQNQLDQNSSLYTTHNPQAQLAPAANYTYSMSTSHAQPTRPDFRRSSSALTVIADAQDRPKPGSTAPVARKLSIVKAPSPAKSKKASTPMTKSVKPTLKKQDSNAEAALQLLALKTSSSSPPPSPEAVVRPVKREIPASEMDAEGEFELDLHLEDDSFADSGYGPVHDDDEEEDTVERTTKRSRQSAKKKENVLAMELPSSPGSFSLSPSPSPPPASLSKSAVASLENKTPTKKRVRKASENDENHGYPQRISLDSSPEGEPLPNRRRLLTSSPVSKHSQTASSGGPSSNSCGSVSSSHLTTPHPNIWTLRNGKAANNASNIFSMDNTGRPSAGVGMLPSSPANFTLSSPEHAAISRSLGLVPESHHPTAFDYQFLRGYDGVQEYAAGVFGGPASER